MQQSEPSFIDKSAAELLEQLNPTQAAAARHYTGPALVIAGAGSGKTRTLIYRIAYLIQHYQVDPSQILAVTFTNKAAAEMRERASHLIGEAASQLWMSTFHSAGVRILRAYGEHIGLQRGFVIFDADDQLDLIKSIMSDMSGLGPDPKPRAIRSFIDKAKSRLHGPHDLLTYDTDRINGFDKDIAIELFRRYEQSKKNQNAIDFNDLIGQTVRLFQEVPEVLGRVQDRAHFIHIDEYQDTNGAQYELSNLLASRDRNLLVVGDPDQSIYRFRGADIQNILDFEKDYPDYEKFKLEHNYRSSGNVLKAANKLIENNEGRIDKTLLAVKDAGATIKHHRALDGRSEGDFVAEQITNLLHSGYQLSQIAVLYRTNAQSRQIEDSLRFAQLSAKIVGGVGFYDRREVKDILAYARLALNTNDDIALQRIISRPRRGIGDVALGKLINWATDNNTSIFQACLAANEVLDRGANKAMAFATLLQDISEATDNYEPAEFFKFAIETSGYAQMLQNEGIEGKTRLENLEELINAAQQWSNENPDSNILDFLDDSALLASVDDMRTKVENKDISEDAVTLMTMHNAKGLEFPIVFIVGTEQGLLPSNGALVEGKAGVEEERRLFYVAITRAMEKLFIVSAEKRLRFGHILDTEDSEFLEDIEGTYEKINQYGEVLNKHIGQTQNQQSKQRKSNQHSSRNNPTGKATTTGKTAIASNYKGGESVRHPKFGEGQVLAVAGMGQNQQITVHFAKVGIKKLLVKLAKLERLA